MYLYMIGIIYDAFDCLLQSLGHDGYSGRWEDFYYSHRENTIPSMRHFRIHI